VAIVATTYLGWTFQTFDHDRYIIAVMSPFAVAIAAAYMARRRAEILGLEMTDGKVWRRRSKV
jgi:hypothetical protein